MRIRQHIYTRERRGIFSHTEGYDTIAASKGLSESFIKEFIHPYCSYAPSRSLHAENADWEDYPRGIIVAPYSSGHILLGQAVHVPRDFTGQRSAFFMHNYILPPDFDLSDTWEGVGIVDNISHVEFRTSYNITDGSVLPELDTLPIKPDMHLYGKPKSRQKLKAPYPEFSSSKLETTLTSLDITPTIFAKLLAHIAESIVGQKKTYVIVPVPPKEMTDYVLKLLKLIYHFLPKVSNRILGFCTYSREPVAMKGIHLNFQENIPHVSPHLKQNFVIDLKEKSADLGFFASYIYDRIWTGEQLRDTLFLKILDPESLSQESLIRIPEPLIQAGKNSESPESFVVLEILRKAALCLSTGQPINIRYLLGSYRLSLEANAKIMGKLKQMYRAYLTPPNYENIAYLFRLSPEGYLDEAGLKSYAAESNDSGIAFLKWAAETKQL